MTDARRPLLADSGETSRSSEVAARLEEGLSDEGGMDFEALLDQSPDEVISYLVLHGSKYLGSFNVKDSEVLPLLRDKQIWTLGEDSPDIDWEATWKRRLQELPDYKRSGGFSTTVEVEAHVLTIKNAAAPSDKGLLNPILEKYNGSALTAQIFGVPALQAVIQWKWSAWARRFLLYELCIFLVWLVSFQVFVWLFQDEDLTLSLEELAHTGRGAATITAAAMALAAMSVFVYIEVCTFVEYGISKWFSMWNSLDILTYGLQVAISVMFFSRHRLDSLLLSGMLALQILLLFWKIQYFCRAFQPSGNTFLESIRAVIASVRWFLLLLLLTLWGFAASFYILYRTEQGEQFVDMWHAFTTTFNYMVGGADVDFFFKSKSPMLGILLLLVFIFTMTVVLLNTLIAIMSEAASNAADKDGTKFLACKAEIIDELEQSLPHWLRQPSWYPKYLHVLKINPASAVKIESSSLWTLSEGGDGAGEAAAQAKQDENFADLKAKMDELSGQVQRLQELLTAAVPAVAES